MISRDLAFVNKDVFTTLQEPLVAILPTTKRMKNAVFPIDEILQHGWNLDISMWHRWNCETFNAINRIDSDPS